MEIPRPAHLEQLRLVLSTEGRGFTYLLADRASGKILRLSRQAALSYARFAAAVAGAATGAAPPTEEDTRQGLGALHLMRQMRDAERFKPARINPVMMSFALFDLGPWQRHLTGLADRVYGVWGAGVAGLLLLTALVLGMRNDWAIVAEFRDVFSVSALQTFALIAPLLKLIHETGHVLAATRYRVRLRKAGINLIALFPVPYVDCTEADLTASRHQRMMISGAGILTDAVIGLVLFSGWHLVEDGIWQLVLGRAFVYNTFNSLMFNANPLMRMDGYFILTDVLGRRNLGTEAAMTLRSARRAAMGQGESPGFSAQVMALAAYAAASMIYRLVAVATILWAILPKYLGFGLVLGLWGGVVMLAPALLRELTPAQVSKATSAAVMPTPRFGPRARLTGLVGLLTAILFLPVPSTLIIDLSPDITGSYAATTARAGFVVTVPPVDAVFDAGHMILTLESPPASDALALARLGVAEARITAQVGRGAGAAGDQLGVERMTTALAKLGLAQQAVDQLVVRAPQAGRLTLTQPLRPGQYLAAGVSIGQFIPADQPVTLTGTFPEKRVTAFDRGLTGVTLWDGASYHPIDPASVHLIEQVRVDQTALERGFVLRVSFTPDDGGLTWFAPQVRLRFQPIPVWRHLADWTRGLVARFRDAEIAERKNRIEKS